MSARECVRRFRFVIFWFRIAGQTDSRPSFSTQRTVRILDAASITQTLLFTSRTAASVSASL